VFIIILKLRPAWLRGAAEAKDIFPFDLQAGVIIIIQFRG
jgi:hypothetical protein